MTSTQAGSPTHPPFDPEVLPALEKVRSLYPPFTAENLPGIRALVSDGVPGLPRFDLTLGGAVATKKLTVQASEDAPQLTLLILYPTSGTGPWPAIYYTHGGGMVMGTAEQGLEELVELVVEIGAVVVSPEYRLAPENPDPAPIDDCYAGLVWTARHAAELGIDADRIMIFGGSAGGGGDRLGRVCIASRGLAHQNYSAHSRSAAPTAHGRADPRERRRQGRLCGP